MPQLIAQTTRPRIAGARGRAASANGAKARPALAPAMRIPTTNTVGDRDRPAIPIPAAASSAAATAVRRAPTRAVNAPVSAVAARYIA